MCCEVDEDENSYSLAMQNYLNALAVWCKMWQLNLNKDKCLVMRIYRRKARSVPTYSLDGVSLVPANSVKYLGILITSDLWWNDHISKIVGLASIGYTLFKEYSEIALKLLKKLAILL